LQILWRQKATVAYTRRFFPQALQAAAELKDLSRGLVQGLGLCFYPHLKCLKRFIVLLPGAAVRIAEDLRMRAGLSLSYDAASRREYGLPNGPHQYTRTPGQPLSSPPFVTDDLPQFAHGSLCSLVSGFPFRL
jgi:hypothetical protein